MEKTRRVATGMANGESTILADEVIDTLIPYPQLPSFYIQNLFYTEDVPQSMATRHLEAPYSKDLPKGAMRFIKIRMPTQAEKIFDLKKAGQEIPKDWSKSNLSRSDSADYIYILSGAITCVVGEKQVHLKAGDFLAQIGPEHAWINDHDEPCDMLCVMVGT